jgi:alkylation response protein AidB-like acyl-CoA dehydrogenase
MIDPTELEDVDSFRARLRRWLAENMPPARDGELTRAFPSDEAEVEYLDRNRSLQRLLFDGGFAGIVFPQEYGGAGLTAAHQQVFNEEIVGYDWPARLQVATFQPCATVLLEFANHEQKLRHIPPLLKGDAIWKQFLSEPSGGSDVAGARTTAIRDGDEWVLNGSKIWTTSAWWGDWALCLARTNWDVPKHRGLTVFMFPIHQPGIEIQRIEMINGSREFCQEFITDLRVPDSDRLGEVDEGWTVGTRWMFYERSFSLSSHITRPATASVE